MYWHRFLIALTLQPTNFTLNVQQNVAAYLLWHMFCSAPFGKRKKRARFTHEDIFNYPWRFREAKQNFSEIIFGLFSGYLFLYNGPLPSIYAW